MRLDTVTVPPSKKWDEHVRLLVRVDADQDETDSLREWLEQEPGVQRGGDLRPGAVTDPEHQGVDIQVLSLAVTTAFSTANLLLAISNWRRSRPETPAVTITRELPDGTTVRIDTFDPDALAQAVRQLENG
jgi:hypothetical protein